MASPSLLNVCTPELGRNQVLVTLVWVCRAPAAFGLAAIGDVVVLLTRIPLMGRSRPPLRLALLGALSFGLIALVPV
jgi:hypothetical protein